MITVKRITMKHIPIVFLSFGCLLLFTTRSFGPPLQPVQPATNVTISIDSLDTAGATLVSVPIARIQESIPTTGLDVNLIQYIPEPGGNPKIEGHLVVERAWGEGSSVWRQWHLETLEFTTRKSVSLTYVGTGPNMIITWLECVPVRYQVLPGPGGTVRERLYMLSTGFTVSPP